MKKPRTYNLTPAKGQALLNFQGRRMPDSVDLYETEVIEEVRQKKQATLLDGEKQQELNADFRNLVIHGDCLSACAYLKSENIKVDLVYIDPPFASGANYAKKIYLRNGGKTPFDSDDTSIGEEIMYGDIWQKEDYLNWLYERLLAIRDVMSETASIYVHLDWHIGHYGKILMDEIIGEDNFRNEVIWYYPNKIPDKRKPLFTNCSDFILFYSKSDEQIFNILYRDIKPHKRAKEVKINGIKQSVRDENGNVVYAEYDKSMLDNVWNIPSLAGSSKEKHEIDYTTQKPELLLKRIIEASSNTGMIIADFFGGSGTTAKIAHDFGRRFITCDVGINAIQTSRDRLRKAGAEFDILKINDGVRLFRNPAQTTEKIFTLIDGYKNRTDLGLGEFWDGGIAGTKGAFVPVKFIGLDKKLTKQLVDVILEEIYQVEESSDDAEGVKIIYATKDLDIDQHYINAELRKSGKSTLKVDLVSLDELLGQKAEALFTPDSAEIEMKKDGKYWKVEIKRYFSSYLKSKIDEFNAKKVKKDEKEELFENGTTEEEKQKKFTPIKISKNGLELIESVQFDTILKKNVWTSNLDLEDKAGVKEKIKGVYRLTTDKFRMKIRNIAGDEIVIESADI
ncbi:MAG: site-specific DNA-methyltransferase [Bacteroidota bacterium]|nr:site-specific DNA-methyltransferase [Bacteroidota bacterium]